MTCPTSLVCTVKGPCIVNKFYSIMILLRNVCFLQIIDNSEVNIFYSIMILLRNFCFLQVVDNSKMRHVKSIQVHLTLLYWINFIVILWNKLLCKVRIPKLICLGWGRKFECLLNSRYRLNVVTVTYFSFFNRWRRTCFYRYCVIFFYE